ncbi:rgr [Drosophila busckii]|uniref:Rgr n=1 Tax=Drosophila busckii TaxID=30019 RepID=A0A0M4FAC1_DROBS|nr:uncharacterized protein LOC108605912 [Drosophila busckii]ALC49675.1 rgr [Drosophila busckii]
MSAALAEVRQKCGSVYTWNCAGELYGVECELCEERPLCALNEFAEHMELWHSDWQQAPEDELMQEVLAEESSAGEVNELKQQVVQQLNAIDVANNEAQETQQLQTLCLNEQIQFSTDTALPTVENQKLSSQHIEQLIELYKAEPRLWNQSHAEFRDVSLGRESWTRITDSWSAHCGRTFTVTDVRIRISTLCQRFLKQRERMQADGDLADGSGKFAHYEQLSFLCEQQTLLNRQQHCTRENRKLLEIYEHYPMLWHNAHKRLRCAETLRKRHEAQRGLQLALRMCGIQLSGIAMQRRLQSLRKRYRLEKIRYLQSVVEGKQAEFVSSFEHYAQMEFLHKHIDPYVCAVCGQIFENLASHQTHVQGSCAVERQQQPSTQAAATVGEIMSQLEQTDMLTSQSSPAEMPTPTPMELPPQAPLEQPPQHIDELHSLAEAAAELQALTSADENSAAQSQPLRNKLRVRLSVAQTQKLIELYQAQANLWDPNHLDYASRKQRRQSWLRITQELNEFSCGKQRYNWHMLHRKLTDYLKYYRRERERQSLDSNWTFYGAFSFLDDVLPVSHVLQKSLQQRDSNLKIIQVYQSYEQLWCTTHADYTKRKQRQRQLESLCTRLQEECNLQLTVERLKNRLIEFRCQYRQCKQSRQAALKRGESWQPNYEYYANLKFLELHVSPFDCTSCDASFKRRTDCLAHQRNVHESQQQQQQQQLVPRKSRSQRSSSSSSNAANALEHICHICGMKFSMRTSLVAHLRRHLGQRTHACNECPKKFFNSTALRVHQRSHTKELPYVCEHCARGFVNASKLNQHVKRHTEQRDYPCNRCDKAFYTAHERDRHIRAHLNIRDKVCPYCSRAFVVGSAYYAHLNLHRGEKRYSCANCGQRFAQYAGLYKHRKRCNPSELPEK